MPAVDEPTVFHRQDAEFRAWIRAHPRGRVLNVPNAMMHTPHCSHIEDLMTKSAKACADGANAESTLRRWARDVKGKRLLICDDCGGEDF